MQNITFAPTHNTLLNLPHIIGLRKNEDPAILNTTASNYSTIKISHLQN